MPQRVIDTLVQQNNLDFAIVDSNNIKGGTYQVTTQAERDSIPASRRKAGMLCIVTSPELKMYVLSGGTDNTNWIEFKSGSDYVPSTYAPIDITASGSNVVSKIVSDTEGNLITVQTRPITTTDIGAADINHTHIGLMSTEQTDKLNSLSNYTHPSYPTRSINTQTSNNEIISTLNIMSDNIGHITGLDIATRQLLASDIGAASSGHDHNDIYYTKIELLDSNSNHTKIDWSVLKNIPDFGSANWLDPVDDLTALSNILNPTTNSIIIVKQSDNNYPGLYIYNNNSWVKLSSLDHYNYTSDEIKTLYEANDNTNVYTDAEKTKLLNLNNYIHPSYASKNLNLDTDGPQVIDTFNITSDATGHITDIGITTRDLTPTDIGAADINHNHDNVYDLKVDNIDWTRIINVPDLGANNWLDPVEDMNALLLIPNPQQNNLILVQNSDSGKPAQFVYNNGNWIKFADVNFDPYTDDQIKTMYEANDNTNAYTDAEKTKLLNLNNYIHPSYTSKNINTDTDGPQVIDTFNITSDATGHITNISINTRDLTPTDIGAADINHTHTVTSNILPSVDFIIDLDNISSPQDKSYILVKENNTLYIYNSDTSSWEEHITNYIHPHYTVQEINTENTDTTVINNLQVISDDTGHVTSFKQTSKQLKLSDFGYTGDLNANNYILKPATDDTLGGIKVGNNLTIDPITGVLSAVVTDGYTHPTYSPTDFNVSTSGAQIIDDIRISSDDTGHIIDLNITTRNLSASDINAADINHEHTEYTKNTDSIEWSRISNVPSFGSDNWLEPVADLDALNAILTPEVNSCIVVQSADNGKPAQYIYSNNSWVKISDIDYHIYTKEDIKTLYESNDNTNVYTDTEKAKLAGLYNYELPDNIDANIITTDDTHLFITVDEKTKLENLNNYTLPIASGSTLGGVMVGAGLDISDGILSVTTSNNTYTASEIKSLYESNSNTNPFTDADKSKLDGLENTSPYTLPIASDTTLGGIKVGSNLSIDANGVLSASNNTYTSEEIKSLYESNDNTNVYTDADKSKVSNIKKEAFIRTFNGDITVIKGLTNQNIILNWSIFGQINSQTINGTTIDPTLRTYTHPTDITEDTTFTLQITDDYGTYSKNFTVKYINFVKIGTSLEPSQIDSAFIDSINGTYNIPTSPYIDSVEVNCLDNQYIYYACPTGTLTFITENGEGGFVLLDTIDYTNQYNYTEQYDVYRSIQKGLGLVTIQTK